MPEDFFEFTAEDLARVTAAHIRSTAAENGPLLTRALREQRHQTAASQYGPVPVRLLFPGDIVVQVGCSWLFGIISSVQTDLRALQALFEPLEQLSEVKRLVQRLLQPGITRWQLYTAPPKQVEHLAAAHVQ